MAVDRAGNFYLLLLSWQETSHHVKLFKMLRNKPDVWIELPEPVTYQTSKGDAYLDKPSIAIDGKKIGIVYSEKTKNQNSSISAVFSGDRGNSRGKPIKLSEDSNRIRSGSDLLLVENVVVAAWTESDHLNAEEVWHTQSGDGGKSFLSARKLYSLKIPFVPPRDYRMALGQMASIANDVRLTKSTDPKNDAFILTITEGTANGSQIVDIILEPLNDGSSVNAIPRRSKNGGMNFFPAVINTPNARAFAYYHRNGNRTSKTETWLTIGSNFEIKPVKLSSQASDWNKTEGDKTNAPIQRIYGDYISCDSFGDTIVTVWTDGRDGFPRIYSRTVNIKPTR